MTADDAVKVAVALVAPRLTEVSPEMESVATSAEAAERVAAVGRCRDEGDGQHNPV